MSYIFVHGLGQNASSWEKTIKGLPDKIEIECPNIFEFGMERLNYNHLYKAFSEYCDAHSDLLDLCGISLGGMLALNYAINQPHKVRSLVLIGTQYCIPNKLMMFQNVIFTFMPQKAFKKTGISKQEMISLTKSMMDLNFEQGLGKITCPVLVICGEKDKANIKAAKQLHNQLGKSTLRIIHHAGHEVNLDNPESLSKELNLFFVY